jgi:ABC-type multidrug transport system fused ATPase/permease subunit
MGISDGQIALGILQLVALSLPVFIFSFRIYVEISDKKLESHLITFIIAFGGIFLIAGAIASLAYLSQITSSVYIRFSLFLILIGLFSLVGLLWSIYSVSVYDSKQKVSDLQNKLNKKEAKLKEEIKENENIKEHETESDLKQELSRVEDTKEILDNLNIKLISNLRSINFNKSLLLSLSVYGLGSIIIFATLRYFRIDPSVVETGVSGLFLSGICLYVYEYVSD